MTIREFKQLLDRAEEAARLEPHREVNVYIYEETDGHGSSGSSPVIHAAGGSILIAPSGAPVNPPGPEGVFS